MGQALRRGRQEAHSARGRQRRPCRALAHPGTGLLHLFPLFRRRRNASEGLHPVRGQSPRGRQSADTVPRRNGASFRRNGGASSVRADPGVPRLQAGPGTPCHAESLAPCLFRQKLLPHGRKPASARSSGRASQRCRHALVQEAGGRLRNFRPSCQSRAPGGSSAR